VTLGRPGFEPGRIRAWLSLRPSQGQVPPSRLRRRRPPFLFCSTIALSTSACELHPFHHPAPSGTNSVTNPAFERFPRMPTFTFLGFKFSKVCTANPHYDSATQTPLFPTACSQALCHSISTRPNSLWLDAVTDATCLLLEDQSFQGGALIRMSVYMISSLGNGWKPCLLRHCVPPPLRGAMSLPILHAHCCCEPPHYLYGLALDQGFAPALPSSFLKALQPPVTFLVSTGPVSRLRAQKHERWNAPFRSYSFPFNAVRFSSEAAEDLSTPGTEIF
jgi:hypothetical protein